MHVGWEVGIWVWEGFVWGCVCGVGIGVSGHVQQCECLWQGQKRAGVCVLGRLGHTVPQISLQKDFFPDTPSQREELPCSTG